MFVASYKTKCVALALMVCAAKGAQAEQPQFCAEAKNGLRSACLMPKGHAIFPTALTKWELKKISAQAVDHTSAVQIALRIGGKIEEQRSWLPLSIQSVRTVLADMISKASTARDLENEFSQPRVKANFASFLEGFIKFSSDNPNIAAANWRLAPGLPARLRLSEGPAVGSLPILNPRIEENVEGVYFAFGGAAGVPFTLSKEAQAGLDLSILKDEGAANLNASGRAGIAYAYKLSENAKLDLGGAADLNSAGPSVQLYTGLALRF